MTTAHSPLRVLRAQAELVAKHLKAFDRGEPIEVKKSGPFIMDLKAIAESKARGSVKFAVVMDDKTLAIELPWSKIAETSEVGIAEFILKQMRDERRKPH